MLITGQFTKPEYRDLLASVRRLIDQIEQWRMPQLPENKVALGQGINMGSAEKHIDQEVKDIFSGVAGGGSKASAANDIFGNSNKSTGKDGDMFAFFNEAGGATAAASTDPFGSSKTDPFGSSKPVDPFGSAKPADPFASAKPADPFASMNSDPFASGNNGNANPSSSGMNDIFGKASTPASDPFAGIGNAVSRSSEDGFYSNIYANNNQIVLLIVFLLYRRRRARIPTSAAGTTIPSSFRDLEILTRLPPQGIAGKIRQKRLGLAR